jgi:hypothetical protein
MGLAEHILLILLWEDRLFRGLSCIKVYWSEESRAIKFRVDLETIYDATLESRPQNVCDSLYTFIGDMLLSTTLLTDKPGVV